MTSRGLLATLSLFAGLTAIAGGVELVFVADGAPVKPPLALLAHTPFRDFLVPGLLLAVLVGGTNTLAGVLVLRRHPRANAEAIVSGGILALWILVEVLLIRGVHWLHGIYLGLGLAILAVAAGRERRAGALGNTMRALGLAMGHATLGWGLCAGIMGALLTTIAPQAAILVHGIAAPMVFVVVSTSYFGRRGAWAPLRAALFFAVVVGLLDLVIVACFVMHSLTMFRSFAGSWLPLLLIAAATLITGTTRGCSVRRRPPNRRGPSHGATAQPSSCASPMSSPSGPRM